MVSGWVDGWMDDYCSSHSLSSAVILPDQSQEHKYQSQSLSSLGYIMSNSLTSVVPPPLLACLLPFVVLAQNLHTG